jgi:hypothetical protein
VCKRKEAERIRASVRLRRAQRNVSGGALIALGLATAQMIPTARISVERTLADALWLS